MITFKYLACLFLLTWLTQATRCNAFLCVDGDIKCRSFFNEKFMKEKISHVSQLFASHCDDRDDAALSISRRTMFSSLAGTVSAGPFLSMYRSFCSNQGDTVNAMGLVHFPCPEGTLMNRYHLMRAGESGLEEQNILSTNPLFLTNTEDGLTALGLTQVEEACSQMIANNINPSVIKYSLASKCIDTANTIANTLMVGRNRIVPEFTFMDPRGAGVWNGLELSTTEAALFALDAAEAGVDGRGGKPPPNEDGTANETLFDQVVRLRQLMSVLETQYSGDDILLVFPDGTSPALLSCLIAGVDLRDVHAFNFEPGEVRIDVTMASTIQSYAARKTATHYTQTLEKGKEQLAHLRKEQTILASAREEPSTLLVPSKAPSLPPRDLVVANDSLKAQSGIEESISRKKDAAMKRRQAYVNDSLKRSQEAVVKDDLGDYPKFSDYMPIASLGAIASMTMWRPPRETDVETAEAVGNKAVAGVASQPFANSTGLAVMPQMVSPSASMVDDEPVTATKVTLPLATPIITEEVPVLSAGIGPNVFEDKPVLSREEIIDAANKAMEEYLERDDGGDDWLRSLKDIMDDE